MKDTEKILKEELSKHFEGQEQRLKMLAKLILGILKLGTVSYSKLCLVISPRVQKDSNFKRIQHFVKGFNFCQKCYIQLVWKLFVLPNQWVALSIDRTNWKFGKSNINILLIGISYKSRTKVKKNLLMMSLRVESMSTWSHKNTLIGTS